jgi:hypothetical protein
VAAIKTAIFLSKLAQRACVLEFLAIWQFLPQKLLDFCTIFIYLGPKVAVVSLTFGRTTLSTTRSLMEEVLETTETEWPP